MLGVVASLPQEEFAFFNKLQDKLRGSPGKPGVIKVTLALALTLALTLTVALTLALTLTLTY